MNISFLKSLFSHYDNGASREISGFGITTFLSLLLHNIKKNCDSSKISGLPHDCMKTVGGSEQ